MTDSQIEFQRYGKDMLVRGKSLNVYYNEVPNRPTLVFVHGLWGSIIQFKKQIEYFTSEYTILALETVGHGYSEYRHNVEEYKMEEIVQDYLDVFKQLHIQNPILVAHSYGALMARLISTKYQVSGIVFLAPLGYLDKDILRKTHIILKNMPKWTLKSIIWFCNRKGEKSMGVNNSLGPNPTDFARRIQWDVTQRNYARFDTISLSILGMEGCSVDEFKQVKCPCLIIGGEFDKTTPMNDHAKRIHECLELPPEKFKSYPVGHILTAEVPDEINADIQQFIKAC